MVLAHDLLENQKTTDIQISQNVTFETMLFSLNTLEGLKKSGFVRPSPIQLHGIPLGKCGFDLLLEAKSGTGKTAVFTVIALEKIDLDKGLQAVILAPTREIASQICDVFRQIGCQFKGLCVEVVMGGLPVQEDIDKLRKNKVHIVVGSPGRLKHLISDNHMDLSAVRLVVFDEADKLMEKSFLPDVKYIHLALPKEKQVIMSSATYSETCKEFIKEFVHDAQHICPNSDCVLLGVAQKVTYVKFNSNSITQTKNKFKEMLKIISTKQFKQCLIFCNYRARVREVYKMLIKEKWPAEQLYGAQDQVDRLDSLKTLQEYKCRILISTDLAARGIDASYVDLVINFEPPFEWQTYLHRIGRAGRFGSYGMAITILSEGVEQKKFMNLLSSVNFSFNVTSFWTDTESNNSNGSKTLVPQDQLQMNGSNDSSYSELWKIICNTEDSPEKEVIKDFEELNKSFHNTKSTRNEIESFSDLYVSFQNNNLPENEELQYKCIKWPDLSTTQCLTGITKKLKNTVPDKDSSAHKLPNHDNRYEKKFCGLSCAENNNHTNSCKKAENDNHSIYNHNINSNSVENSFAEPRYNRKPSSSSNSNRDFQMRPDTHTNIQQSTSSSSNEDFHFRPDNYANRKLNSSISSSEDFTSGHNKLNSKYKSQPKVGNTHQRVGNAQQKVENTQQFKVGYSQLKRSSGCPHNSTDSSTDKTNSEVHPTREHQAACISNSYNDWYKELKIRVKQIELAIYIDELSKL